jgi:ABC-type antimicrobial peptide transport system permease subunit
MALGARKTDVFRLVLGQGFRLSLAGLVLGVALSLATTRFLKSALYGVSATDALTFAGALHFCSRRSLSSPPTFPPDEPPTLTPWLPCAANRSPSHSRATRPRGISVILIPREVIDP